MVTSIIKNTQLKVLTKRFTVTYNNSRYASFNADLTESGYTALGVVGFGANDSVNNEFNLINIVNNYLSVTMYRSNGSASSDSVVITLFVLYQRI